MQRSFILCLSLLSSLTFTACQKEVAIGKNEYKTLGTSAHDLLSADNYPALVVKIDYMPGYTPDAATIANFGLFLNTYLNKPGGIRITESQIPASGKSELSIDEIVEIEKINRPVFTGEGEVAVHILITDGSFSNKDILATSYWNTSFCLFGKSVYENSGGFAQVSRTKLTTILMEHEFGHLLGLVDQGSPMIANHKDINNGAHCDNPDCLMYFQIETANSAGTTLGGEIPSFDSNCIADLKANGGK